MANYAYVDKNNIVLNVISGRDEYDSDIDWEEYYGALRTSYNTRGGIHYDPDTNTASLDQSKSFRYNFAGKGFTFDPDFGTDGAFIPPQPYPSWILNTQTANWMSPKPKPEVGKWVWNEETLDWVEF